VHLTDLRNKVLSSRQRDETGKKKGRETELGLSVIPQNCPAFSLQFWSCGGTFSSRVIRRCQKKEKSTNRVGD